MINHYFRSQLSPHRLTVSTAVVILICMYRDDCDTAVIKVSFLGVFFDGEEETLIQSKKCKELLLLHGESLEKSGP